MPVEQRVRQAKLGAAWGAALSILGAWKFYSAVGEIRLDWVGVVVYALLGAFAGLVLTRQQLVLALGLLTFLVLMN